MERNGNEGARHEMGQLLNIKYFIDLSVNKFFRIVRNHLQAILLCMYVCAAGRLVQKLPEGRPVYGVTSISDEIFVLRNDKIDQVEVYDATSFRLLRCLTVPHAGGYSDMTSCEHYRCLYVADPVVRCVHRLEVDGEAAVTRWPLSDRPVGLSVNAAHNVIVTCNEVRRITELGYHQGDVLREVALPDDVVNPIHAIQTRSGRFVVCHGDDDDAVQRVCIISPDGGRVVHSHGGRPGSGAGHYKVG